jgi:hypothetical protein
MTCTCGSDRIVSICGKTSDLCTVDFKGIEHDGYVPSDIGIGSSDYIEFDYCLCCGIIQDEWPKADPSFAVNEDD